MGILTIIAIVVLQAYVGCLVIWHLAFFITTFVRPKGVWLLVPFRVSGWRSIFVRNRIYRLKWMWQKPDFNDWWEGE